MFATDPETYTRLRDAWSKRVQEADFENIDVPLIPALMLFNQIPGVASFMSCMSHPEERVILLNTGLSVPNHPRHKMFYISFAFTDEGLTHITEFYPMLRDVVIERWPRHIVNNAGPRSLSLSFGVRGGGENSDWWNSGCLNMSLSPHEPWVRNEFLALFEQQLRLYITLLETKDSTDED